jgi:hypothetical protein
MQEFAPTKSRLSGDCPSDEELAAYIDGALDKEEAARVAGHLVSCERCYEIYSETLRFQLDSEVAVAPGGKVVPFPSATERRRPVLRWLPFAALLLVGIGAGTYVHLLAPPPELTTAEVTAPIPDQPRQQFWFGPRTRGGGGREEEDRIKIDEAAFRLGVQLVNLQVSLKTKDAEDAEDAIAFILGLLESGYFTEDLPRDYAAIKADLVGGKAPADVLPEASRLARESRGVFDPTYLDLGQWVEAAHLATLSRNPSFFQQADTRSFLRRLRWRDKLGIGDTKLDPTTRESLERIADIVSKGDLQASDYDKLKAQCEKILDKYYPES